MKSILTLSTLVLAAAAGSVSAQTNSTTFPDIAVDLLGPSSLQIGRSDRYILKVTNAGSALATNAAAVVSLPPGLGLYRSTPPSGCSYSTTQRKLSCTIAQIAVGATSTLRIDLKSIGAGPSTEAVQVTASVSGEPVGNQLDNTDTLSTSIGSFTPILSFPTSQAMYLCNGQKDIFATNCWATDAVYGSHGAAPFDASGTYTQTNGNRFVARQVSSTYLMVDLWTASGVNTVLWTLTPQNATCWQGQATAYAIPGFGYEVRLCQP